MDQMKVLEVAKGGEAWAISRLLNSSLGRKGLTVEATKKDQWLSIVVYGKTVPDRLTVAQFIRNGIIKLNPSGITGVSVCGRISGQKINSWIEDFYLTPPPKVSPTANFKSYGWLGLVISGLILVGALFYSPTVDGTYNIGKISDRGVFADIGLAGVISGTILLVYGDYRDRKDR